LGKPDIPIRHQDGPEMTKYDIRSRLRAATGEPVEAPFREIPGDTMPASTSAATQSQLQENTDMTRPVCAIVGGGEGFGRALAANFASNGCDIALVSRSAVGSHAALLAARSAAPAARVEFFAADAGRAAELEGTLATRHVSRRLGIRGRLRVICAT
jgi:short chain dehydrogenase